MAHMCVMIGAACGRGPARGRRWPSVTRLGAPGLRVLRDPRGARGNRRAVASALAWARDPRALSRAKRTGPLHTYSAAAPRTARRLSLFERCAGGERRQD
eukprot:scaffold624_cov402-Prasinococcus_capsulatus_cf.AAC.40